METRLSRRSYKGAILLIPLDKAGKSFKLDIVSVDIRQPASLWLCSHVGCDSSWVSVPFECHTNHSVTNGHERSWWTARVRVFEMSNVRLLRGGRWSLLQLFIIQSAAVHVCWCWRHSHRSRGTKPSVFEQQVVIQSCCLLPVHFAQGGFKTAQQHISIIPSSLLLCSDNCLMNKCQKIFKYDQQFSKTLDEMLKMLVLL